MKKGAGIFLYNKEKKILLQHRDDDAPVEPSKWGVFGGGMEKGETPLEAVKRECFEELGYNLKDPKLIYEGIYKECYIYLYIEAYNPAKKLILGEGQDMRWFSLEEAKKLNYIYDIKVYQHIFKKIKNLS